MIYWLFVFLIPFYIKRKTTAANIDAITDLGNKPNGKMVLYLG
ncbi:hypothetical protein SAMN05443549_102217 [Flavobacterium fluvii]|uniref:Uncharacterized protein n=1 Tax=Flavobacterium fluvii TaxID=468056 RepID=A0A1M5HFQ9_9FLAO|nr:hypothetical protein SAMN05443549_102217 [Flavobacterium fluvii]